MTDPNDEIRAIWEEIRQAREETYGVKIDRIRVTARAIAGLITILPYTPERSRERGEQAEFKREILMHPDDWDALRRSWPAQHLGPFTPEAAQVFGIPVYLERR